MADEQTLFDLPNAPEQIGVILPPAKLRRVEFSALDFSTARRSIIEYIRTYFPDDFNDFVAANGVTMFSEIVASNTAKLSLRADLLNGENFLSTAKTEEAVSNHLELIAQRIRRPTPAVVDLEVSVEVPLSTDVRIEPGMRFQVQGPNNETVYYEMYKAPGDFSSNVIIPAGKRGVIAYGLEGRFAGELTVSSPGGSSQNYQLNQADVLESPIFVTVEVGDEIQDWTATEEPLARFGTNDRVVNVTFLADSVLFLFGDNINGAAPQAGQEIKIRYRIGGGIRGRIGRLTINEARTVVPEPPAGVPISILVRNLEPSSGGQDRETLDQAKKRAPRDFVVRAFASDRPASIVTDQDYAQVASTFSHPVFGSVAKAVATIRTGLNANLAELYILADGSDSLVAPSLGLKTALTTYIDEFNVNTDTVSVLDGVLKAIDIDMTVVINRNTDATILRTRVETALDKLFSVTSREMGESLFVSDIVEQVSTIPGVTYVDLLGPANNILRTGTLASVDDDGVGINEMVVEGKRTVRYHYEKQRT